MSALQDFLKANPEAQAAMDREIAAAAKHATKKALDARAERIIKLVETDGTYVPEDVKSAIRTDMSPEEFKLQQIARGAKGRR